MVCRVTASSLTVRPIGAAEHLAFLDRQRSASFLQTPAWGRVKSEWESETLGWYDGDRLVGVGLALHRRVPRLRRSLAYLPEGPVIDWAEAAVGDLLTWLDPLVAHLKARGAFGVRIGPPVVVNRWTAAAVKQGIADDGCRRLTELTPSESSATGAGVVARLRELGWRRVAGAEGFAAGQPAFNFLLPLKGRSEDDVLRGMNQQWRRNIRKADKAGVEVERGTEADLDAFHELYAHTAGRDGFTPRPLSYFRTMLTALGAEDPAGAIDIRLYLARHEGDLVAATIGIRVGGHVWYSYGASSTDKREVRGSNAVQWRMIRDAIAEGADVYDLRGITDTLDADDPHLGLVQFKVGTGGEAVEYAGEWDLPLSRPLYKAFDLYMKRRAGR